MRDGMIVYREQIHEVGRVGYRLSWSSERDPQDAHNRTLRHDGLQPLERSRDQRSPHAHELLRSGQHN